jgi:hypothetical protein
MEHIHRARRAVSVFLITAFMDLAFHAIRKAAGRA